MNGKLARAIRRVTKFHPAAPREYDIGAPTPKQISRDSIQLRGRKGIIAMARSGESSNEVVGQARAMEVAGKEIGPDDALVIPHGVITCTGNRRTYQAYKKLVRSGA